MDCNYIDKFDIILSFRINVINITKSVILMNIILIRTRNSYEKIYRDCKIVIVNKFTNSEINYTQPFLII